MMPREAVVYTVVVASAGDTDEERQAVLEAIHAWNATHSAATGVVLLPVPWEVPSGTETSDREVLRDADILVGTFWTRLGTAGEEVDEFRKAGKRVLLYFSDAPAIPSRVNREQYGQLENYRLQRERERLAEGYGSVGELRAKFPQHLATVVRELHAASPEPAAGRSGPAKVVAERRSAAPPRARTAPARAGATSARAEASAAPPGRRAVGPAVSRAAPAAKLSEQRRPVTAPRPEPARPAPIAPQAADRPANQGSATVVREGGWWGVLIGGDFYAWEGPLTDLPEREPVEMAPELEPRLRTALNEAGALPSWQTNTDLLTWRDEQRVFITDRRTYKRAIASGKDILFVRPRR
jgi:hypothetical protein